MSHATAEFFDFNARVALFDIDEDTRALLHTTWPIIQSHVAKGVDDYFESVKAPPRAANKILPHKEII